MKKYLIIFYIFFVHYLSFSQTVKVIDNLNNPIPFVSIFNNLKKNGIITDKNGEADIEIFNNNDVIIIQHPSYEKINLNLEEIIKNNFVIKLNEKVFKIDEIVISANKWEQSKSDISSQILDLSENEIKYLNPETSAELLEKTGQVFVQKSQLGGGSPMIRGFSANRILIVLDGIRLNNAIYRSGNLHNIISIDPNILEGAEVLFGPASVIYGSDAIGGVMDFHTKKIKFSAEKKLNFNGNSLIKYYSASNSKHFNLNFSLRNKNFSSFSSISFKNFDDLKTGNKRTEKHPDFGKRLEFVEVGNTDKIITNTNYNIQKYSGYSQLNLIQKFKFKFLKNNLISYNIYYSNSSDIPRYDRLIQYDDFLTPKYSQWYYGPQKFLMNKVNLSFFNMNKFYDALSINISNQIINESRYDRKYQNNLLRSRTEKLNIYTINLDFDKKFDDENEIYYGFELLFNKINSSAFIKNISDNSLSGTSTRYPDGGSQYNSFASYISYKKNISKKIKLNAGSRFSSIFLNSKFSNKEFFNFPYSKIESTFKAINGNIGLIYLPNKNHQFNYLISTGFRAPNLDDIGKVFDSEPGNIIVPNINLKPEYSINNEINFRKIINNKHKIEASIYYSRLNNAMVRGNYQFNGKDSIIYDGEISRVQAILNTGKAYVWGYSVLLNLSLNKYINLISTLNYNDGKDLISNKPLRHISPIFGKSSISFNKNKFRISYFINYNGKKELNSLSPSELNKLYLYTSNGSLRWLTHNLNTNINFNSLLDLSISIENIFNVHYRTYSSGISAPGRSLNISCNFIF